MFIRLTRTDGQPIWLNASFIVTVEPARSGGAIVVPIGDGFDYEVRESPGTVLSMLDGAPVPQVVPVPPPKLLTPLPEDVSPESFRKEDMNPEKPEKPSEAPAPQKRGRKKAQKKENKGKKLRKLRKKQLQILSRKLFRKIIILQPQKPLLNFHMNLAVTATEFMPTTFWEGKQA